MMKIITKNISEIKPNDYNPNQIPEDKYKALVENIKRFGYLQPILIDQKGVIIDGWHRWKAAKEVGLKKLQCVVFEGNGSIKQYKKLLTLSMNNLRGQNDEDAFEAVIQDIAKDMEIDDISQLTGFDENLINSIIKDDYYLHDDKIKEKEIDILNTENKCPKCNYEW